MCNSRGNNDEDEDNTMKLEEIVITNKTIPSKQGRKGDPRMHKAVEARLTNPKLSLLEALQIGGFEFHYVKEVSYDKDNVLLSQRKNQLSRRIRLFKQSQQKKETPSETSTSTTSKETRPVRLPVQQAGTKRPNAGAVVDTGKPKKEKYDKESKKPVPVVQSNVNQLLPQLSNSSGFTLSGAHLAALTGNTNPMNSLAAHAAHGGNNTFPNVTLPTNLSRDDKIKQASNLYSRESTTAVKNCMLVSGFSIEEIQESSETFQKVKEALVENEYMRLQMMKANNQRLSLAANNNHLSDFLSHEQMRTLMAQSVGQSMAVAAPTQLLGLRAQNNNYNLNDMMFTSTHQDRSLVS